MKRKTTILLFFVWVASHFCLFSQETPSHLSFKFKNISVEEGLSNSSVSSIVQDDYGFIWIGTRDGLNRFNSFDFEIFRESPQDTNSISDNWVRDLIVDKEGALWIATKNGLNKYDHRTGFKTFFHNPDSANTLTDNNIFKLHEDSHGFLWIATAQGLNRFDPIQKIFTRFYYKQQTHHSLSSNLVRAVYEDNEGHIWLVTGAAIDRFDVKKKLFKHYPLSDMSTGKLVINEPADILQDRKGRIWVGLPNGLWSYDAKKDEFVPYSEVTTINQKGIERVRSIHEDSNGDLWIGTYDGLFLANPDKGYFRHLVHQEQNPYNLNGNSIYAIFEDRTGDMWFGSWWGGLGYLDRDFDNFLHFNEVSGLSFSVVSSFAENEEENFWIGTEGGGVNFFDRSTKAFQAYEHDKNLPNSLASNNVQDIALHQGNKLILGTHGMGLDIFWFQQQKPWFQHFSHQAGDENSISSNWTNTILTDSKNRVWVGTNNAGLNHFDVEKGIFIRYREVGKSNSRVNTIFEDRQKNIWAGTDKGLGFVDETKQEVDYLVAKKVNEEIIKDVLCIYQDSNNNYWLGSEGDGLIFFEDGFSNIRKYRQEDGLPNNVIYGILADDQRNLWLSTNNGLSKFDPETHRFENYDIKDGLQSNEFNRDAFTRSSKGEFLFGGVDGFNIFYPEKVEKTTYHPPLVITDLRVKGERTSMMAISGIEGPAITLKHNQMPFSLDFVVLNYAKPGKNKLAYQLYGQDDNWIEIDNNRNQTFTALDAGTYIFRVKAASIDGQWNQEYATVKIKIRPPWWRSWWAYLLYSLSVFCAGMLIRQQILVRKKDKRALKKEKEEREKLESINQLKLQFFTQVSHELRTPLTLIYGPLEKLKQGKKLLNLEQQEALQLIDANTQRLLRHVNNILDFRKDEFGLLKLKAFEGNFVKFVKEVFLSFQELAKSRAINYQFETPKEHFSLYFDRDQMEVILFNLLANAFKYTSDQGTIRLRIYQTPASNSISLAIEDNGRGIAPQHQAYVFEPYFQIEEASASEAHDPKGSGIGLALTKRLVELHHGLIEVANSALGGACFIVHFPIGDKHLTVDDIDGQYQSSEDIQGYLKQKGASEESRIAGIEDKKKQPTLLIVEDNKEVRAFITNCLNSTYNIVQAVDGKEGYDKAVMIMPDLIISDVMMPKMDGISLCSKLKTEFHTSHIPVILLTARTSLIYEKSGLETGADDYITKPFSPSLLTLRVRNLLDARKKLQQHFVRNLKVKPKEVTVTSRDNQFLAQAVECVEKHLTDDSFDATVFAQKMNCSESTLYKKLKAITGQSISAFTRTIRIKRAAQLLEQGESSIAQVAYSVGFNDLKYFRQCFRKQFGQSPSAYSKEHKYY